jgi:hypothetical protein
LNFRDNGRQPNPNQARAESNRPQDVRSNPSTVNTRQSDGNPVINPRQRALQRMNTPEHQQQTPGRPSYRDQIDARRATESSMRQRNDSGQHRAQPGWQRSEQHGVSNASRRNFNEQAPRQRTAGQQRPGSDNWRNARTSSNSESPRDRGGAGERGGFGERSHSQR